MQLASNAMQYRTWTNFLQCPTGTMTEIVIFPWILLVYSRIRQYSKASKSWPISRSTLPFFTQQLFCIVVQLQAKYDLLVEVHSGHAQMCSFLSKATFRNGAGKSGINCYISPSSSDRLIEDLCWTDYMLRLTNTHILKYLYSMQVFFDHADVISITRVNYSRSFCSYSNSHQRK
jgi:hypothetical protein